MSLLLLILWRLERPECCILSAASLSRCLLHQLNLRLYTVVDVDFRNRNYLFLKCCPGIINFCLNSCRLKISTQLRPKRAKIHPLWPFPTKQPSWLAWVALYASCSHMKYSVQDRICLSAASTPPIHPASVPCPGSHLLGVTTLGSQYEF